MRLLRVAALAQHGGAAAVPSWCSSARCTDLSMPTMTGDTWRMVSLRALAGLSAAALTVAIGCGNGASDAASPADAAAGADDAAVVCGECAEGVCNPATGACVECLRADHCTAAAPICEENVCVKCLASDDACSAPGDPDPADAGAPADAGPRDAGPAEPTAFEIRLASYNVRTSNLNNSAWGDTHIGWDSNDAARMQRIADTIASQALTVVAAQEMRRPERDAVLGRLKDKHAQDWGFTTAVQGADDTVVLFRKSVWTKVREVHFIIPMQAGLEDRNQVGVLLEHKATGREVWVYSVHFAAGDTAASNAARAEAAKRTVASIKARAVDDKLPFVLAGDFNATSDENVGDVFRASGFMKYTRTAAEKLVNNGCKTFNGRAGSAGLQACYGGVAAHIDQIWIDKAGMQVLKYQITANEQTSRSSDHNPVTTILKKS